MKAEQALQLCYTGEVCPSACMQGYVMTPCHFSSEGTQPLYIRLQLIGWRGIFQLCYVELEVDLPTVLAGQAPLYSSLQSCNKVQRVSLAIAIGTFLRQGNWINLSIPDHVQPLMFRHALVLDSIVIRMSRQRICKMEAGRVPAIRQVPPDSEGNFLLP